MSKVYSIIGKVFLAAAVVAVLAAGTYLLFKRTFVPELVTNAYLAKYAHWRAEKLGEEAPPDISMLRPDKYYGVMYSNCEWCAGETFKIVPFFQLEGLTPGLGIYPDALLVLPRPGTGSLKVGGQAFCFFDNTKDSIVWIRLNERGYRSRYATKADLLGTLVHELIHLQGGRFCDREDMVDTEASTEAASLEILAARALAGDKTSRRAFWISIESFARTEMYYTALKADMGWLYQIFADINFRDARERAAADKWGRFWENKQADLMNVMFRYGIRPWRDYVLPGALHNATFRTGIKSVYVQYGWLYTLHGSVFEWDDTQDMLGLWKYVLRISRW